MDLKVLTRGWNDEVYCCFSRVIRGLISIASVSIQSLEFESLSRHGHGTLACEKLTS